MKLLFQPKHHFKICLKSNSIPNKRLIFNVRRKKWHEHRNVRRIFCNLAFLEIILSTIGGLLYEINI